MALMGTAVQQIYGDGAAFSGRVKDIYIDVDGFFRTSVVEFDDGVVGEIEGEDVRSMQGKTDE